MVCLLLEVIDQASVSAPQIPKKELNAIASMISAGTPIETVKAAWGELLVKYKDSDTKKAIEYIVKESGRMMDKTVKGVRGKVTKLESARKQVQFELIRIRKGSEQATKGKSNVKVKQKVMLMEAERVKLKESGAILASSEDFQREISKWEENTRTIESEIRQANQDLESAVQRQEQIPRTLADLSSALENIGPGTTPAAGSRVVQQKKPTNGLLRALTPQQWADKTVRLAPGITFRVPDYVHTSSFRNRENMKFVFDSGFQNRFLKKPAEYIEEVQETDDRLVVTRTLVLDTKDPKDPGMERAGFSLRFKPTGKTMKPEARKLLEKVRTKMRNRIRSDPNDPEASRAQSLLQLSDEQLLGQLLNTPGPKKIVHESIVPYLAYDAKKAPSMDVSDLRRPLPKSNLLDLNHSDSRIDKTAADQARFLLPEITDFTPKEGKTGEAITITGRNLDKVFDAALVENGTDAYQLTITSSSAERIVASGISAPAGEKTIRLQWSGGKVESGPFHVVWEPEKAVPPVAGPYTWENKRTFSTDFLMGVRYAIFPHETYEITFAEETDWHDRYYASFSWNFALEFYLRWPFTVEGTTEIDKVYSGPGSPGDMRDYPAQRPEDLCSGIYIGGEWARLNAPLCAQRARVTLKAKAINAGESFYRHVGVLQDEIAGGNEFVFKLNLTSRFKASVPLVDISIPASKTADFSQSYTPPLGPGSHDLVRAELDAHEYGLALSLGPAYASLNPGILVTGDDGRLSLGVSGYAAYTDLDGRSVTLTDQTAMFHVSEDNARGNWGIDLSKPRFALSASIEPTLSIAFGVDLYVYEWSFSSPIDLSRLAIDLGEASFPQYAGTRGRYSIREIGRRPTPAPRPVNAPPPPPVRKKN